MHGISRPSPNRALLTRDQHARHLGRRERESKPAVRRFASLGIAPTEPEA
jgi:hypothetical protein